MGNSLSAARRQRNFQEKSSSRVGDLQMAVLNFQFIIDHQGVFVVISFATRDFFFLKSPKEKKKVKNAKLVVLNVK